MPLLQVCFYATFVLHSLLTAPLPPPENKYANAAEKYTEAIALNPTVAVYYSNRSLMHFKLELFGLAIEDANAAIALEPSFIKAYYRRASAYMSLMKFKEALKDLRTVRFDCCQFYLGF